MGARSRTDRFNQRPRGSKSSPRRSSVTCQCCTQQLISRKFLEHLVRTGKVPGHAHSTEQVDRLGEMYAGLLVLAHGLEHLRIREVASRQLRSGSDFPLDSDGFQDLTLPLGARRALPDQGFGKRSMGEGGMEP